MPIQMTRQQYFEKYGVNPGEKSTVVQQAVEQDQGSSGFKGFGVGLAKSAGSLAQGVGEFGRGIQTKISQGVDKVAGTEGFGLSGSNAIFDKGSNINTKTREALLADSGAEKVGKFVGDVSQFAIPAGSAMKATKGAGALKMVFGQGASDALVQTVQQGEVNRSTLDSAILGAAFPAAGKVKNLLGKGGGSKVINSLIKPLKKDFAYGKNPGLEVARQGIKANNLDELAVNIGKRRVQVGQKISEKIKGVNANYNLTKVFKPLDDAIEQASKTPNTNRAVLNRLEGLKEDVIGLAGDLTNKNVEGVVALKKQIGELTRWTGNLSDDEIVNKSLRKVYGSLKGELDETVPGLKNLNDSYANLKTAEIATQYRDSIAKRGNLVSLPAVNTGIGGAVVASIVSGGAITPSILVGIGAGGMKKAMGSTAFKTRLAAWLSEAPKDQVQSLLKEAPWMRGIIQNMFIE